MMQVSEQRPLELRIAPRLGTYYYGLNLHHAQFRNRCESELVYTCCVADSFPLMDNVSQA